MGQASSPKQGHECRLEWTYALKKVSQRPFSADGIADQHGQKINGFIGAEASSY
jgi:hypothetical protein